MKKFLILLFASIAAALLILGGCFDLQISHALVNTDSLWARIMEVAAEPPTILLCSLMGFLLFHRARRYRRHLPAGFFLIAGCGTVIYTVIRTFLYVNWPPVWGIPLMFLLTLLFFYVALRLEKRLTPEVARTTVSCVIAALTTLVLINLFKLMWGRVRYRDLLAADDFNAFTPWYLPQGWTGNRSFPSGHTSNTVLLFFVCYYFKHFRATHKRYQPWILAGVSVWALATMVSRVLIGAHYLSDVAAGAAITALIVWTVAHLRHE